MPFWSLLKKHFGIVPCLFRLLQKCFKKVMCQTRKLRRDSGTVLPFTTDRIGSTTILQDVPSNEAELEPWDSWGSDMPCTSENSNSIYQSNSGLHSTKVEEYRQKQNQQQQQLEGEQNYFEDMQPQVQKAKMLLVETTIGDKRTSFEMVNCTPNATAELSLWEETASTWEIEEDLAWEADIVIRETKRQDRKKRQEQQQRKREEREASRPTRQDSFKAVRLPNSNNSYY